MDRQRIAALVLLCRSLRLMQSRVWVHPINGWRQEKGAYHNLVQMLWEYPEKHHKNTSGGVQLR